MLIVNNSFSGVYVATHNISSNVDSEILWEICQGIVTFCTIVDIYLFACLVRFHHIRKYPKKNKAKHCSHEKSPNPSETPKNAFYARGRSACRGESSRTRSGPNKKFKLWMLRVAIASTFFANLKYFVDQMKFFYAWNSRTDYACELTNDLTEVALYGIAMNCVYAFLWMRQWLFYNNPAVKGLLYRKHLIVFSKCLPIVIVTLSSILAVFHLIPQRYKVDVWSEHYVGCISVYDMNNIDDAWSIVMYIVLTSTFQLSLLGLFIYPFIRRKIDMLPHHRKGLEAIDQRNKKSSPVQQSRPPSLSRIFSNRERKAVYTDSPSSSRRGDGLSIDTTTSHNFLQMPISDSQNSGLDDGKKDSVTSHLKNNLRIIICPKSKRPKTKTISPVLGVRPTSHHSSQVFKAIRRVVFWCAMCIISDATTVLVALLNGPGTPLILITALNNVNILINQLCIVATYSKWREILFPICYKIQHHTHMGFATSVESRNHHECTPVISRRQSIHVALHTRAKFSNVKPPSIITSLVS